MIHWNNSPVQTRNKMLVGVAKIARLTGLQVSFRDIRYTSMILVQYSQVSNFANCLCALDVGSQCGKWLLITRFAVYF